MVPKKDADGNDTREMIVAMLTADEERLTRDWKADLKDWKQGEAVVKQQIATTILDSLFMKIRDKGTALEIWVALQSDFQNKSRMVAVDLRHRLQQEHCPEKGDVRAQFAKLRTMREDLAAMGHPPDDDEFYATILGSLPSSFEPFISALNATPSVLGTVLSPDELMQAFTDEYDCRSFGKTPKRDENAAFSAAEGSGRKGNPKGKKKGKCNNCGKPGHWARDYWEEGGGKEGQKPNFKSKGKGREDDKDGKGKDKPKPKDSAANSKADEDDVAWMAECLSDFYDAESLTSISSNVSLEDLMKTDKELQKDIGAAISGMSIQGEEYETFAGHTLAKDKGERAFTTTFDSAALSKTGKTSIETELFDSGASCHMSGYHHRFINFVEIQPKPITAADKRQFYANGKGNMYLEVPNGNSHSRVLLRDVLYSPTMGITLVSVGRITSAGSIVTGRASNGWGRFWRGRRWRNMVGKL